MKISKKILSFIFLIEFLLLSINSITNGETIVTPDNEVYVDDVLDENASVIPVYNSYLDNITPNYQIIPIVDKKTINRGDTFTISFQISGNGKVISNKLIISFPKEFLKDEPLYSLYIGEFNRSNRTFGIWYDKIPQTHEGSKEGTFISLVNTTFKQYLNETGLIFGEKAVRGHRPIKILVNSSDNAPEGDNKIEIQFFYSDGVNWYNSQDEITIHVNTFVEQHAIIITIIIPFITAIFGTFVGYLLGKKRKNKNSIQSILPRKTNTKKIEKTPQKRMPKSKLK